MHILLTANCRLNFKAVRARQIERDGQRVIDRSFQSTVYPSEEGCMHCRKQQYMLQFAQATELGLLTVAVFGLTFAHTLSLSLSRGHAHKNKAANKIHSISIPPIL